MVPVNRFRVVLWLAPVSLVRRDSLVKLDNKVSRASQDNRVKPGSKARRVSRVVKQAAGRQAEVRRMAWAIDWRA